MLIFLCFCSGSGVQDIRNVVPFSGKGFLLGGKSQTSSSTSSSLSAPVPVVTPSPVQKPSASVPPFRNLHSPVCSGSSDQTKPSGSSTSAGGKPPVKRSVGNSRVFVNVGGSPVKIPKPPSSSGGQGADKLKQRSIQDLFENADLKKSTPRFSNSSTTETKGDALSLLKTSSVFTKQEETSSSVGAKTKFPPSAASGGSASKSTGSKYLSGSGAVCTPGAAGGGQTLRKRLWDDGSSSASIFDFFEKTLGSSSTTSRERGAATSSSSGPHAASSSSSAVMVSCPACQTKVQESQINQHLDSCLS